MYDFYTNLIIKDQVVLNFFMCILLQCKQYKNIRTSIDTNLVNCLAACRIT